jgi:OOP family OmpA-OmpF porin
LSQLKIKKEGKKMRRKFSLIVLALFAAVLLYTPVAAKNLPGEWSITPFAGGYTYDTRYDQDTNLDTSLLYGLRVGYNMTKRWSLEAVGTYANAFGDRPVPYHGDLRDNNAKMYGYRMEGMYNFLPDTDLALFIAAGMGGRILDYDISDRQHRFLLGYGLGFKYFFARHWALRGDVRHLYLPNTNSEGRNNFEYTLGISFLFGGKTEEPLPEPKPQPKPAVVKSEPVVAPTFNYVEDDVRDVPPLKCPNTPIDLKVDKDGCPIKITVHLNVLFDFDKSDVKSRYHNDIKRVADYLKAYPDERVTLEGHTDSRGTDEYNQRLSQRRVDNIKSYLVNQFGINPNRLTAVGHGESRPVADNITDEGRQLNRRVDAVMENYLRK